MKTSYPHVRQHDQTDCGPACLLMALRFHGADAPLERLREWSGTSVQGTTMLGLLQAARQAGLQAEGFEAGVHDLQECPDLCILHVIKEERLAHFILVYGYEPSRNAFRISDPAEEAPRWLHPEELAAMWKSKALLRLQPTDRLVRTVERRKNQRQWLWELVREDVPLLGIALVLGLITAVLGMALALFSQKLLDQIIPAADRLRLFAGAGLLLALLLARSALGYARQVLLLRQSREMNLRLTTHFYSLLLHLPKPFFDNRKTGDLVARLNDTQRIQRTVAALAGGALIDVLTLLTALCFLFVYSWPIGLGAIGWLPLFLVVIFRYHQPILKQQREAMAAYAFTESHYIDHIQGVGTIKMANRQAIFARLGSEVFGAFQQTVYRLGLTGARFGWAAEVTGTVFLAGIIAWSGYQTLLGTLTPGGMIALLQMAAMLVAAAASLSGANLQLQEARVAFDRMYAFASLESEAALEVETPQAIIPVFEELRVEKLAFRFPGRARLLNEISFRVRKGEWICIVGESGCGKSTLLQILQKFYPAESGLLKVNGIDLDMVGYQPWRSRLGVVPQEIKLFNGTLLDNILLGQENPDLTALDNLLKTYGFHPFFSQLPNGYLTLLGEDGVKLSGGQKQLVALARALHQQPDLLLLDEPTAALDRDTELFVLRLLARLMPGMGIILLTHRLRTARAADRIYVLENGAMHIHGSHEELLQSDNLYSRAWSDFTGPLPVPAISD